jgi:transglutaminase-like putative cysteine protease
VLNVAKYRLADADGSTEEENKAEYDAVTKAADDLAAQIDELVASDEMGRIQYDEDSLYAIYVYQELGRRTTYSDDIDDTPHNNDIYGALIEGETKCYGISTAAKALLNRRGIPSFVASGAAHGDPSQRHAWVIAWIDDEWRVLDVTSAQGSVPPATVVDAASCSGFWWGCLPTYDQYVESHDMMVDEDCKELMRAYEKLVAPYLSVKAVPGMSLVNAIRDGGSTIDSPLDGGMPDVDAEAGAAEQID